MDPARPRIMLVDDNVTNLTTGKAALKDWFQVFTLPSAAKLFELLEKVTPDLILLDIEMSEMDGFQAIQRLKAEEKTAAIPVIFLTASADPVQEEEGRRLGAADYIQKPFSGPDLRERIKKQFFLSNIH
ncbi:MAG: response regulator [Treponema sp.]|jgi:putative two-component system response regulator|nr:response regulator [Treponema sp.]